MKSLKPGEGLELYVLSVLRSDGMHLVRKQDPAVRVIRWLPQNQFRGTFLERGPLDLAGSHRGWHFELEVKDCLGMRWPLSKLREHQVMRMEDLHSDGAVSGLALRLRGANANHDHIFLVPARRVLDMLAAGKKSITLEMLQELESRGLVVRHEYNRRGDAKKFFEITLETLAKP